MKMNIYLETYKAVKEGLEIAHKAIKDIKKSEVYMDRFVVNPKMEMILNLNITIKKAKEESLLLLEKINKEVKEEKDES